LLWVAELRFGKCRKAYFFSKASPLLAKKEFANPLKVSDIIGKEEFANPFFAYLDLLLYYINFV